MSSAAAVSSPSSAPLAPRYGNPIFGAGPAFAKRPIETFFDIHRAVGDTARIRLIVPPFNAMILAHPDHIQRVLVDNAKNYGKQTRGYEKLRDFLGNGLVTSEGDFWKRQRRIANPAFHRERISHFGDVMVRCANEMIDTWGAKLARGQSFDASREMMQATLRIIGLTMLSTDVQGEAKVVSQALDDILHITVDRILNPFQLPSFFPTPTNRRFDGSRAALDGIVTRVIAERRAGKGPSETQGDLLAMLMAARDPETGEGMSDQQLRDEVMTMFLAGHETTAVALSWALDLLSRHPEVARRLRAEVDEVLGKRPATLADLPKLAFTDRVLHETMRLYPPVWSLARSTIEEDVVGGYRVPKGSWLFMSAYFTHRDPRFWPNPEGFDPDRFLPEEDAKRPKGAYFPFIIGPRKCIGEAFALMEARLLLATIVQRAELSLVPGFTTEMDPVVTLRPKHGVKMQGKLRN